MRESRRGYSDGSPGPEWAADLIGLDTAGALEKWDEYQNYNMFNDIDEVELAYARGELDLLIAEYGRD